MKNQNCLTITVSNQKGGVGKTTTAINLAQALALRNLKILIVDLDPQGNATQGLGVKLESVQTSISDLLRSTNVCADHAIYEGDGLYLIPATPLLASVEQEMVGITNSELHLAYQLRKLKDRFDVILIDTPPTFGSLLNSALNAANGLLVPVDSSFFAMMGIKALLAEIEKISLTNPTLQVIGYLLTLVDHTQIAKDVLNTLRLDFGELTFNTTIRRCVKLREAPSLGRTIFHHAPASTAAQDYLSLASELIERSNLTNV